MGVGLVEKPQRAENKGAAQPGADSSNAGIKDELKGKPYDEQVQLLTPPDGAQAAPVPAPTKDEAQAPAPGPDANAPAADAQAGGESEADKLRATIANRAKEKSGKEVMDPAQKKKVIEGYTDDKGVKHAGSANFTTCIEFARSTMSEGSSEMYKDDAAKAQATGAAMSDAKVQWETAQGEKEKARNYGNYAAKFKVTVDEYTKKAEDAKLKVKELRTKLEGETDAAFKQRSSQAVGLEANIRAWESVAKAQQKQVDMYNNMRDAALKKAEEMHAANKAMIIAQPGLGARPKPGEFIILAQGPEGKMYGKTKGKEQWLAAGAFKHIAVFMGLVAEDAEMETWQITEGGGELAETNEIRIRKKDLMVFTKYNAANDVGSAQGSQLGGWMDAGELIKARDRKAGGKK